MFALSAPRRNALALILAAASWGLGTVISKHALEEIPPLILLPTQLGSSLGLLVVLLRGRGLSLRGATAAPTLGRLGLLNPGLAYALGLAGLVSITASLSVLLWAIEPVLILVMAGLWLHERITAPLIGLSVAALAGVILLIYDPASSGNWLGIALTLAGVICCAAYTVIARRWLATADSTLQVVAIQEAYALGFAVVLLAGWSVLNGGFQLASVSPIGWLSAIASGVLYYAAAYWFYLTGLRAAPASIASASFYLIPVFGVSGGLVLLGDRLDGRQWTGVVIVLVAIITLARRYSVRPTVEIAGSEPAAR